MRGTTCLHWQADSELTCCPCHQEWLDLEKAVACLRTHGLRVPVVGGKLREFDPGQRIMFWEVYSGCGNATHAFVESASGDHEIAGPLVDTVRKAWFGLPSWNVLLPPYASSCGRSWLCASPCGYIVHLRAPSGAACPEEPITAVASRTKTSACKPWCT